MKSYIEPGTTVRINRPGQPETDALYGTVIAVQIYYGGCIQYQVCWWDDSDRFEQWLEECEVEESENEEND